MASLIHPNYRSEVALSIATTVAAGCALFSRYETAKIIGLTVLTAVGYGVLNNMVACRHCSEYFIVEDEPSKKDPMTARLVRSLSPSVNALIWAVWWWQRSCYFGACFAAAARIPFSKSVYQISARQLAPYMAACAAVTFVIANLKARNAQIALQDEIDVGDLMISQKHPGVHKTLQAAWEACTVRTHMNRTGGYVASIVLIIGMVVSRLGLIKLPRMPQ